MVEYNENKDDTPRKRKGLFGGRRARSTDVPLHDALPAPVDTTRQQAEPQQQPEPRQQPEQQHAERDVPSRQSEQPTVEQTEQPTEASATGASAPAAPTSPPARKAPARRASTRSTSAADAADVADAGDASAVDAAAPVTPPRTRAPRKPRSAAVAAEPDEKVADDQDAPFPTEAATPPAASARPSTSLLFQAPDLPAYAIRPSRDDARDDDRRDDDRRDNRNNDDRRDNRNNDNRNNDNRGDNRNGDNRNGDNRNGDNRNNDNRNGGRDGFGRDDSRPSDQQDDETTTVRRRSRRRTGEEDRDNGSGNPRNTVVKVRQPRPEPELITEPQRIKGSTRLEAKKQRRRDGRDAGRRRPVITEAEFLARRESVDRVMVVRSKFGRIQIGVLEDSVLSEHYVAKSQEASLIGNVYLGRVQNVLPSMEAAFVDIGRGRNAVLYSGEVDWEAAAENSADGKTQARRIELALKPGDKVLVQVTKDPIGHKGARLTSQVSLPGRYLVYVPNGSMNGISRKLPDTERARLKKILKEVLPENVGVIVRTAAEGATDEQLTLDVNRLTSQWTTISETIVSAQAPALLHSEPDLLVKIVRDVFNEDFQKLVIEGEDAEATITTYLEQVAPDLIDRIERYSSTVDSFDEYRISEQIEKALDRKVWLPSGGSLVIDRTEAMTVVDVNTGKFVGSGGNLEETVTKNNLEAAEEIVRQLRLRDIGGIIVVDFIDMVLESNRDLVLRRLVECLSRDRTKHQVAEVTSLGLVQMTRKKLGLGLIESFSENCEACAGRGIVVQHDPTTKHRQSPQPETGRRGRKGGNGGNASVSQGAPKAGGGTHAITEDARSALAKIATSTIVHADTTADASRTPDAPVADAPVADAPVADAPVVDAPVADAPVATVPVIELPESRLPVVVELPAERPVSRRRAAASTVELPVVELSVVEVPLADVVEDAAISVPAAILDIPVQKQDRAPRRISTQDAELILDSVLDALPEPRPAGQGRARTSRRASSAGTVSAPVEGN